MDGQAPLPDAVAPEPLAVADGPQPSPTSEAEDAHALPSGLDGQAPPLDSGESETLIVSGELPPPLPLEVEVEGALPDTVSAISSGPAEAGEGGVVLTDELRDKIVKQVEYYFSDENLPTDEYMLRYVKKNGKGFIPIQNIATFGRMKKLVQDLSVIKAALRTSSKLVVSSDGKKIRRLHPLTHSGLEDSMKSTVLVENLPTDFSVESIQEIFGAVGKIVRVTINDPESLKETATAKKAVFILSSKVHALVEYESVKSAEKAVTTFNDESSWRTGMKVKLLQPSKENHDTVSKKNNQNQPSKQEQHTTSEKNCSVDTLESAKDKENSIVLIQGEHQHQKPNPKGGKKGRYRGQGKGQGQIQHNTNIQGGSGSESLNRPIPGPRMPDGTRGFTMGRGRSLPLQKFERAEE